MVSLFQVETAAAALPKKANWDLKRDVASRLAKLDRQTSRAIAEIIRERVVGPQQGVAGSEPSRSVVPSQTMELDAEALVRAVAGTDTMTTEDDDEGTGTAAT